MRDGLDLPELSKREKKRVVYIAVQSRLEQRPRRATGTEWVYTADKANINTRPFGVEAVT